MAKYNTIQLLLEIMHLFNSVSIQCNIYIHMHRWECVCKGQGHRYNRPYQMDERAGQRLGCQREGTPSDHSSYDVLESVFILLMSKTPTCWASVQ